MKTQGKPLAALDMLIGAHATSLGAVLVTNDRAFQQISNLRVEGWTQDLTRTTLCDRFFVVTAFV